MIDVPFTETLNKNNNGYDEIVFSVSMKNPVSCEQENIYGCIRIALSVKQTGGVSISAYEDAKACVFSELLKLVAFYYDNGFVF